MCCSVCDMRPCDLAWREVQIEGVQEHWKPGQLKALRREANAQVDKGPAHQMLAGDTVTHTETCSMMGKPYCSGSICCMLVICHLLHLPSAQCPCPSTGPYDSTMAVAPFMPFILPFPVDEVFQNAACHMLSV